MTNADAPYSTIINNIPNISNYDFLLMICYSKQTGYDRLSHSQIIPVDKIAFHSTEDKPAVVGGDSYFINSCSLYFTSATSVKAYLYTKVAGTIGFVEIYGIK